WRATPRRARRAPGAPRRCSGPTRRAPSARARPRTVRGATGRGRAPGAARPVARPSPRGRAAVRRGRPARAARGKRSAWRPRRLRQAPQPGGARGRRAWAESRVRGGAPLESVRAATGRLVLAPGGDGRERRVHAATPTTARDVVWTLNAARDPATGYPRLNDLAGVSWVTDPDDSTVVVRFAAPQRGFPDVLTDLAILPSRLLDSVPASRLREAAWNDHPVGNGPFRFVSHEPRRRWVFAADSTFPAALAGP